MGIKIPVKPIAGLLVVAAIAGGCFTLYQRDTENMHLARTDFQNAGQFVQNKEFAQAKKAFDQAQSALANILVIDRAGKQDLQKQIDAVINTQSFQEGLQGRVLYDGQYVSIDTAKAIDGFKLHLGAAEMSLRKGNIDEAIASYEKSLEFAEKAGFQDQALNIRQTVSNLRLQQTLSQARKAEEDKQWQQAAETYQKAMELSSTLSKPEDRNDIAQRLAAASFQHELDESKRAFTSSEWQKTIEMLQRAQDILKENPTIASEKEKNEIAKLLVDSRLFQILSDARKDFEREEWERAITQYNSAITLLKQNTATLGQEEVADNIKKIEKTILMSRIAREQRQATMTAKDSNLEAALKHYREIVALIDQSAFQDEAVLKKILENADAQTVALEKEVQVNRRVAWLTENFDKIFRENYPSAKSSELLHPQVTFIRKDGNIMIFNMSCVEKRQGRTFRLELNYQYDAEKDSWKLYSGKL